MNKQERKARNKKIVAAYNRGRRIADIAETFGLSMPSIQQIVSDARARGEVTRKGRQASPTSPARIATVVERYNDGETLAQIGDRLGVTRERVRQILAEAGIERRSRSSYFDAEYEQFTALHGSAIDASFDRIRSVSGVIAAHPYLPPASIRRYLQPRLNEVVRTNPHDKVWSDDALLEVLRAAAAGRRTLTIPQYTRWRNSGVTVDGRRPPTIAVISWRFGTWRDAVTRAGFAVNPLPRTYTRRWSKDDAIASVRSFAATSLANGQRPTYFAYTQWAKHNPENPSGPYVRYLAGQKWSETLREALVTQ